MPNPPFTPRRYEVFVLRHLIQALGRRFAGLPWQPRPLPPTDEVLRRPYFRLPLPQGAGEVIWQPIYAGSPQLPIRTISHVMRPDMVIERGGALLVIDAKHRFQEAATIRILDTLHAYRDGLVDPSSAIRLSPAGRST